MPRASIFALFLALLLPLAACGRDAEVMAPSAPPSLALAAASITVTNTNDQGAGSLRDAIAGAPAGSTIQFHSSIAGGTITLSTGQLVIDKALTIHGPAAAGVTISGGGASRVFILTGTADVVMRNVTITDGATVGRGGGVYNSGMLRLENVLVRNNRALAGSREVPNGGGIYNIPDLLHPVDAHVTLVNSTVTANHAEENGGGIGSNTGITLINSTLTGNSAAVKAGGIYFPGQLAVLTLENTIIAGNSAPLDANCSIAGQGQYTGSNMFGDFGCNPRVVDFVADPLLAPLAANGGPTWTHALLVGSPAIDAAISCTVTEDQRHVARPQGARCDIGAFEFDDYTSLSISVDPRGALSGSGAASVSGSLACAAPATVTIRVTVQQPLRFGGGAPLVLGSTDTAVDCTTTATWSVSVVPSSGAYKNGAAAVTVRTVSAPASVAPTSVTASIRLSRSK